MQVRVHPSSVNSGLELWRGEEGEGEPATLAFYDEITRGESFLCTSEYDKGRGEEGDIFLRLPLPINRTSSIT